MMTVEGRMSLIRQELTEIRHFLFCFDPSHFAAFHPQNKNIFLKFKTQDGGERDRGEGGRAASRRVDDGAETQMIRGNDRKLKYR